MSKTGASRSRRCRRLPSSRTQHDDSSMPGTMLNSGAIAGRAATASDASGTARRTSAIAGSAMTASPSQLGAKTTSRRTVGFTGDRGCATHVRLK